MLLKVLSGSDTDVGRGSLKLPAIKCLTLGFSRGMNRATLSYCNYGDYPTRIPGRMGMPVDKSYRHTNPLSS